MNEVVCVSGVEHLMDYLEEAVAPDLRAAMESHVAGCPGCAAFIASYLGTPRIVREATEAPLPTSVEASLKAFLRARTTAFRSS